MKFSRRLINLEFSGVVGGLIFFSLSFTPSLLPRGDVVQGVAAGISFAIGYGLGVAVADIYRRFKPRKWRSFFKDNLKGAVLIVLGTFSAVFVFLGYGWQADVRILTNAEPVSDFSALLVLAIAALLARGLIGLGRLVVRLSKYFSTKLNRRFNASFSRYAGVALAAIVVIGVVDGILLKGAFNFTNAAFGLVNKGTPAGIYQPQNPIFSGSPESVIDWNSLGEKGREFVASGPSEVDIDSFFGPDGVTPSRVYVGLDSAPTLTDRVDLVISELERTGAEDRQAIVIAVPTGSGGINSKSVSTLEYLYGGDTTAIGIQYSFLPSWISFLADQDKVRDTGKLLFDKVYDWWDGLPAQSRPEIFMYGESLGTLGADGAFSSPADMRNRTSGVLLAGPPNANNLWTYIVSNRDEGSPMVLPIYDEGQNVRFGASPADFDNPLMSDWDSKRIGILQHGSDPVVWWAPELMFRRPDWLHEPRGYDVASNMRWYPFVTFWQVALDLPFAFSATDGHGHRYGTHLVDSWIELLDLEIGQQRTQELEQIISQVKG